MVESIAIVGSLCDSDRLNGAECSDVPKVDESCCQGGCNMFDTLVQNLLECCSEWYRGR